MFSYYDETIKKNASVDVSEDKGIQQAGELFYLTNPAYGEADYRYFTISLKIALHNSGVSCSLDFKKIKLEANSRLPLSQLCGSYCRWEWFSFF